MTSISTLEDQKDESFKIIKEYIVSSWREGKRNANLWIYFFLAIVLMGGLGCWASIVTVIKSWTVPDVLFALCTYAPTIVAATCLDLIFAKSEKKSLMSLGLAVGAVVCVLATLSLLSKNYAWPAYILAVLSVLVAWFVWFLVNANNENLKERSNYKTPVGDTDSKVSGNEEGFVL